MKAKRLHVAYLIAALLLIGALGTAGFLYLKHRQTKPAQTAQFAPLPDFPHHNPATRAEEYQAADNYLIAHVGADNFHKYFQRWPEKTSWADPKISDFDFLGYRNNLLRKYTDDDNWQYIQVNRKNLQEVYGSVPPCAIDSSQCDFALSKDDAKRIAQIHGLTGELDVYVSEVPHSKIHEYALGVESCNEKKVLYIDYATGRVVKEDEGCISAKLDDL